MVSIIGSGHHLPAGVLDNDAVGSAAGVTPDWIVKRTGIRERRVAGPGIGTARMGEAAARAALTDARVEAADLGLIVVATSTPDHLTPPTACEIQAGLGADRAACFDMEAGFAGWLYALVTASALVGAGVSEGPALVVGVEKLSTVTDRSDPGTAPLFGDGAGAVVVAGHAPGEPPDAGAAPGEAVSRGLTLLASSWWADGRLAGALLRPSGGARRPFDADVLEERSHLLRMEGTRLFRQAVRTMAAQATRALERAGIGTRDVALVVPHQANLRIITATASELGVPMERVMVNIDRYGNTGAATIPLALDEARRQGRIPDGGRVLLVSFGAGATAGAVVLSSPSRSA